MNSWIDELAIDGEGRLFDGEGRLFDGEGRLSDGEDRRFLWKMLIFVNKLRRNFQKGQNHVQTVRGAICYRMMWTRASGTPCGSSYGRLKF